MECGASSLYSSPQPSPAFLWGIAFAKRYIECGEHAGFFALRVPRDCEPNSGGRVPNPQSLGGCIEWLCRGDQHYAFRASCRRDRLSSDRYPDPRNAPDNELDRGPECPGGYRRIYLYRDI